MLFQFSSPEDTGSMFLRNVGVYLQFLTVRNPEGQHRYSLKDLEFFLKFYLYFLVKCHILWDKVKLITMRPLLICLHPVAFNGQFNVVV
jgi:hypothetical protein